MKVSGVSSAQQLRKTLVKLYEQRLESMQEKLKDGNGSSSLESRVDMMTFLIGELQQMEFV